MEKVGDKDEMAEMRKVVAGLKESAFVELPNKYGNVMSVFAKDFKDLAKEGRGSDVMFIVRGAIKGVDSNKPMVESSREDEGKCIEIYMFDCALVHGACGGKKKMSGKGLGKYHTEK